MTTRQQITYAQSGTAIAAPDDADVTLTGHDDALMLGTGDALVIAATAYVDTVDAPADTGATITVASGATGLTFGGTGTLDFSGSADSPSFLAGSQFTLDSSGSIDLTAAPGVSLIVKGPSVSVTFDTGPVDYRLPVPSGLGSLDLTTFAEPDANGLVARAQTFDRFGAAGALIRQNDTGVAAVDTAGSGAFGIFHVTQYYNDGPQGTDGLFGTVYDIVTGISIYDAKFATANQYGIVGERVTYSGLNGTGTVTDGKYDYGNGTSAHLTPFNGAYGIFRTVTYYSGADLTGSVTQTSYDIVTGISVSDYAANGAFGVYKASATTAGFDANGDVGHADLDIVDGHSIVLAQSVSNPTLYTETTMSGLDGSGAALSSGTLSATAAQSTFGAFTGFALDFGGTPSATSQPKLALADFHAATAALPTSAPADPLPPAAPSPLPAPAHPVLIHRPN